MNGTTNGSQYPNPTGHINRKVRAVLLDLHDLSTDPTGRLDILVARMVKRAVDSSPDPLLRMLYNQFQPHLDGLIHNVAKKYDCAGTLRRLGVIPPKPRRPRTSEEKRARRRRRAM